MSQQGASTEDTVVASPASEVRTSGRPIVASSPDYEGLRVVDPDHYALTKEIARGGMGRIWIAHDRRLGRDVALKEVLVGSEAIVRRFEREARITARLQHPSIVAVLEAGTWPSGEPFYAMPLVSGRSLDEVLAAAPRFADRLALLPHVLAVADAMAYAHGRRVIHRDLKPRNIVVGEFGETVVLDWGLAKELGSDDSFGSAPAPASASSSASAPGETTAGDILGTPAYMPLEQAAGHAVDARADVYAIGAVLYHLLANEPPYRSPSSAEVIAAVMLEPPAPIRERAPEAPTELVAIVERAMARDAAARYPTARELADDLRRFQTGQLVGAHRYSTRQLVRRWMRRHRTAIAAVAAAVIVGIAIGVIALHRILAADRLVAEESAVAQANRKSSEALTDFMLGDLEKKLVDVGRLDLLDAIASRAVQYYDERGDVGSDDDRYALARARGLVGSAFVKRGDVVDGRVQLDRSALLFAELGARHPGEVKYATAAIRIEYGLAGMSGTAAETLARLRPAVERADRLASDHPGDIDALRTASDGDMHLAFMLIASDPPTALASSAHGVELANVLAKLATDEADEVTIMHAHRERGHVLDKIQHDAAAPPEFQLAIGAGEQWLVAHPHANEVLNELATAHRELGAALRSHGDLAGAQRELQAGAAIAERLHRLDASNVKWAHELLAIDEKLGIVLEAAHDDTAALDRYRAAEAVAGEISAADPSNADDLSNVAAEALLLGALQLHLKQSGAALESFQRAAAIDRALIDRRYDIAAEQRRLYMTMTAIASALSELPGRMRDALAAVRDALAIAERLADRELRGQAHAEIGEVLLELHDTAAAHAELETALDILAQLPPSADDAKIVAHLRQLLSKPAKRAR